MPQPLAVFPAFPCEQPSIQSKQDRRKLAASAAGLSAFHELVAHLVVEHERVLTRNSALSAENARLQAGATAPRAPTAPWDAGFGAAPEELGFSELAGDLPGFPFSTAGRPVLASERQLERAEAGTPWPGAGEAAGPAGGPFGRRSGSPARGGGPKGHADLVDSGTQTCREGEEEQGPWDAKGGWDVKGVWDAKGAQDEHVVQGTEDAGDDCVLQGGEDCDDEHIIQSVDEEADNGMESAAGEEQGEGTAIPRRGLKRSDSMSSHISTTSANIRRYSSNGRTMSKPMTVAYLFLEDADSSRKAMAYKIFMQTLLFISVGTPLLQMMDPPVISGVAAAAVETAFDTIFTVDLLVRLIVNPAPWTFFQNKYNVIDLLSPAALILRAVVGFEITLEEPLSASAIILLCFTPILRLMKMLRRWGTIHLLTKAFVDVFEALPVLLFPLLVITLLFSTLIYIVEPRDNIPTLAKAVWLTMVTMTTVGYGDVTPSSVPGSFVVGILVISSVMYMAMPVAILGSSFTTVWQDRDTVMLLHRTKERLQQWGYSVHDIPILFQVFDKDSSGELNVKEFVRMMKTMRLGLNDEQIFSLFRAFDGDGSGEIDDKEFVKILFPSKYVEVYGADDDGDGDVEVIGPK